MKKRKTDTAITMTPFLCVSFENDPDILEIWGPYNTYTGYAFKLGFSNQSHSERPENGTIVKEAVFRMLPDPGS